MSRDASLCSPAKAEENLDGEPLPEVERGWRDIKQVIDLRPVYHRNEERMRAYVILCWLAQPRTQPNSGRIG